MTHEPSIKVVYYDAERIPDDRPGAGDVPVQLFERVRNDIVAACRKHGLVGPDDIKGGLRCDESTYWVVDDQYNDERYQYVEVNRPEAFTSAWLRDVMAVLREHPYWGVGVMTVPPGYILIFEDRLLVTAPLFQKCKTMDEVAERARKQIELDNLVRSSHDDASLERLSRAPMMAQAQVESLYLEKVTDAGLVYLAGLTGVRGVGLNGAPITDAGLVHLQALTALHSLGLENTRITDEGMIHLAKLYNLTELALRGCRISDDGLAQLLPLRNLESIQLDCTDITDAGLAHLRAFPNLKNLTLDGAAVTDAGVTHLRSLIKLRYLQIRETGVNGQGALSLQQALPECEIFLDKD